MAARRRQAAPAAAAAPPPPPDAPKHRAEGPSVFEEGGDAVKVCARIRPLNDLEEMKSSEVSLDALPDGETIVHKSQTGTEHVFRFDRVFQEVAGQEDLYDAVAKPMLEGVLDGFNGAILAYGQTGSGKTFTMQGHNQAAGRGIAPRVFEGLFETMKETPAGVTWELRASFLEVYNEKLHDLLTLGKGSLSIMEDKTRGLFITGATEVPITSAQGALDTYYEGIANRTVFETEMNADSSRSHAVFLLTVARYEPERRLTKYSQLYLVDLAGSEKVWKTGAAGDRLDEAKYINKSLLALGNVIHALSSKADHVPYRDSKLTRLLQNSLGGNSRTALIVCVSPSMWNAQETLSTLRFGDRTQRITNVAVSNEVLGAEQLQELLNAAHLKIASNASKIDKMQFEYEQFEQFFTYVGVDVADIEALSRLDTDADAIGAGAGAGAGAGGPISPDPGTAPLSPASFAKSAWASSVAPPEFDADDDSPMRRTHGSMSNTVNKRDVDVELSRTVLAAALEREAEKAPLPADVMDALYAEDSSSSSSSEAGDEDSGSDVDATPASVTPTAFLGASAGAAAGSGSGAVAGSGSGSAPAKNTAAGAGGPLDGAAQKNDRRRRASSTTSRTKNGSSLKVGAKVGAKKRKKKKKPSALSKAATATRAAIRAMSRFGVRGTPTKGMPDPVPLVRRASSPSAELPSAVPLSRCSSLGSVDDPEAIPWQAVKDQGSGALYYYHPITRETTWYKPKNAVVLPPPASDPAAGDDVDPALWKEAMDADGRTYWFHPVTRATRWEKP